MLPHIAACGFDVFIVSVPGSWNNPLLTDVTLKISGQSIFSDRFLPDAKNAVPQWTRRFFQFRSGDLSVSFPLFDRFIAVRHKLFQCRIRVFAFFYPIVRGISQVHAVKAVKRTIVNTGGLDLLIGA